MYQWVQENLLGVNRIRIGWGSKEIVFSISTFDLFLLLPELPKNIPHKPPSPKLEKQKKTALKTSNEAIVSRKVLVVGDEACGKSSLVLRYTTNFFREQYSPTKLADYKRTTIDLDGTQINAQIWDTSAIKQYRSMNIPHYRGSNICMILYDITNRTSFENLNFWVSEVKSQFPNDLPTLFVIGCKSDRTEDACITQKEAFAWCSAANIPCAVVSCKTGNGVTEAFAAAFRASLQL
eukprot:TRINITY_DN17703_c0_g1_i1.p1 TRINITY_DN17703_c0_g1~~TRINITY_DN17703_c0_g1_i1.p1  ORF type:complete len:236 (-),score=34.81 TRINITY_DN17703_c0_g1_i1:1-708(-)